MTSTTAPTPVATTALSFAEEQLWLADRAGARVCPFLECAPALSIAVRLEGCLHHRALCASLQEIVNRHDVLRSRFITETSGPVRRCASHEPVTIATVDLRAAVRPRPLRDAIAQLAARPFDLARGPLLRAALIVLGDEEHVLAITVHHIVFDRWSRRVLMQELKALYDAYVAGQQPGLAPLPVQYADYVRWQHEQVESPRGNETLDYWTSRLRGLRDLVLPADLDGDRAQASSRAGSAWFTIAAAEMNGLRTLSRRCRTTVATTMASVLMWLVHRRTGADDIAMGVPLSDRRRPELEFPIGLFMNVVILRSSIAGDLTFLDLLDRVRRDLLDACKHQDLPYGSLLRAMRASAARPLYRVVFNFMPAIPSTDVELSGLRGTPIPVTTDPESLADLSLHLQPHAGGLTCRLVYKADLFSPAWARQFAAQYQSLTTATLADPRRSLRSYALA